jgi:IS605 OrfB family transposase
MKLIARIKLLPTAEDAARLKATMERFNEAADFVAGIAFGRRTANVFDLRRMCYEEVRERFGLSSQMAQLAIKAASDAYKRDKSKRVRFKKHSAVPYDIRTMSFKGPDRVSLLTLDGRVKVAFIVGDYDAGRMDLPRGQSDLIYRDGKWLLYVTVDVPDGTPIEPDDFIGVDLGIANIATDSDGERHSGKDVDDVRRKHNLQRKRLGKRNTKGAKKKIRRMRDKEARFRRHQNHVISKRIVETAKRTGRGIALEDLEGIRQRVTARGGEARNRLSGWAFAQLGSFVDYKARLAGIPVVYVDPAYTSQTCNECGHCERSNRKGQDRFHCQACGHQAHADVNAARNIRCRALAKSKLATGLGSHPDGRVA